MTRTGNLLIPLSLSRAKAAGSTCEESAEAIALLTRGLAAGDEVAFREFHERYFDVLYQFLLVVARGQEHEAQEALQLTLLRVVRYARVFESEEAFSDWLKVLARSAARDAGRKQRRYIAVLQKFARFWETQNTESSSREGEQMRNVLEESLEELDPRDRKLIEEKYLQGLTVKELSAVAGSSEKAVESRLVRLRRELRERMIKKLRAP